VIVQGASDGLRLGASVATADLDGDGYADLIIGTAPDDPAQSAVGVLFGGPTLFERLGPHNLTSLTSPDGALIQASAAGGFDGLGGLVAAGDLDADGRADLAATLGRPSSVTRTPQDVALLSGRSLADYRAGRITALPDEYCVLQGPAESGFGTFLGVGDVNGDRRLDLIIGAPFEDLTFSADFDPDYSLLPREQAGAIYIVLGSRLGEYWPNQPIDLEALLQPAVPLNQVPFGLLVVRGIQSLGYFGAAMATSSNLAQIEPFDPHAYTMVLEPGWFEGATPEARHRGRLLGLYLPFLLPCENGALCSGP
jgi:hypothetical protein